MADPDTTAQPWERKPNGSAPWPHAACAARIATLTTLRDDYAFRLAQMTQHRDNWLAAAIGASKIKAERDAALARAEQAERDAAAIERSADYWNRRVTALKALNDEKARRLEQAERERDEAVGLLREYWAYDAREAAEQGDDREPAEGSLTARTHAFLSRLSTEGEPADDRCPACGWPDPWQDGEDPTCRDPWHTTPKDTG